MRFSEYQTIFRSLRWVVAAVALAGCSDKPAPGFQGYVEGEYVYVSSAEAGRLEQLQVCRGQQVTNGAPLFVLESALESAVRRQAQQVVAAAEAQWADLKAGKRPQELAVVQAQLAQAQAVEKQAAAEWVREEVVFKTQAISAAQLDVTRAFAEASAARVRELQGQLTVAELPAREEQIKAQAAVVAAARATLEQVDWRLHQKALAATCGSLVFDTLFREGEWVPAGRPVISLLPPGNIKVRFFVPETRVGTLTIGQTVTLHRDGVADVAARISYIATQAEYTPPIIYSNETRSKLVFLIEATPAADAAAGLHPGQPVEVRLP
ncbi:MAG: HlyD family efflux transporter periplasmic adaptor subunit [bacterium]